MLPVTPSIDSSNRACSPDAAAEFTSPSRFWNTPTNLIIFPNRLALCSTLPILHYPHVAVEFLSFTKAMSYKRSTETTTNINHQLLHFFLFNTTSLISCLWFLYFYLIRFLIKKILNKIRKKILLKPNTLIYFMYVSYLIFYIQILKKIHKLNTKKKSKTEKVALMQHYKLSYYILPSLWNLSTCFFFLSYVTETLID